GPEAVRHGYDPLRSLATAQPERELFAYTDAWRHDVRISAVDAAPQFVPAPLIRGVYLGRVVQLRFLGSGEQLQVTHEHGEAIYNVRIEEGRVRAKLASVSIQPSAYASAS
ncbi:MAG: hypothetical protein ACREV0_08540, partial [Burkholderiales bacterium]